MVVVDGLIVAIVVAFVVRLAIFLHNDSHLVQLDRSYTAEVEKLRTLQEEARNAKAEAASEATQSGSEPGAFVAERTVQVHDGKRRYRLVAGERAGDSVVQQFEIDARGQVRKSLGEVCADLDRVLEQRLRLGGAAA